MGPSLGGGIVSLLLFLGSTSSALKILPRSLSCPSNDTYIGWPIYDASVGNDDTLSTEGGGKCEYQTRAEAERECGAYLRANVMAFDVPKMESMGFPPASYREGAQNPKVAAQETVVAAAWTTNPISKATPAEPKAELDERNRRRLAAVKKDPPPLPDGLADGLVGHSIQLALDAKALYYWTGTIPKSIYHEYVLNYANADEPRTSWRPLIHDALQPTLRRLLQQRNIVSVSEVVSAVNSDLWTALGKKTDRNEPIPIKFVGGQTPNIYDAMSVITYGHGSCTGLAILFVNALRSAGVPARIAGTPAWYGNRMKGNHSWVEVYNPQSRRWEFMEPTPGINEGGYDKIDGLSQNPCSRWFCKPAQFPDGKTKVFAARLDKTNAVDSYRMAWNWDNLDVPGVERTDYYTSVCGSCGKG